MVKRRVSEWKALYPAAEPLLAVEGDAPPADVDGVHVCVPRDLFNWLVPVGSSAGEGESPTLCFWYVPRTARWHGVLHNRRAKCSLFRSAETLGDLVEALAAALSREPAGWKRDRTAL